MIDRQISEDMGLPRQNFEEILTGEVAEWLKVALSKSVVPKGT